MQECALCSANFSSRNWHKNCIVAGFGGDILPRKVDVSCVLCAFINFCLFNFL